MFRLAQPGLALAQPGLALEQSGLALEQPGLAQAQDTKLPALKTQAEGYLTCASPGRRTTIEDEHSKYVAHSKRLKWKHPILIQPIRHAGP
jgi:hypothetical protein